MTLARLVGSRMREWRISLTNLVSSGRKSTRLALACAVLTLASIGGYAGGEVAADTLIPRESTGGPGGGSGSAVVLLEADPTGVSIDDVSPARDRLCPPCATP